MAKTVRDVMTPQPQTVQRLTAVRFAAGLMEREDVGSLPVVEEDGELVGIVTDRDIALRVVGAGRDPETTQVGEILTEHPVLVFPDESLDDALELMAKHQVRRLPVVADRQLVGVLAQADVVQEAKDKQAGQLLEQISQPATDQR
jgi:CBS domain-containing protein